MLFAQQAAAAIVNARAHRAERRARADLEALVETCPVNDVSHNKKPPHPPPELDAAVDILLAYKPKKKKKAGEPRKRRRK